MDEIVVQDLLYIKGKKFVWNPMNRATKQVETEHVHCGKTVSVISEDTLDRIWISVDDFPNCNDREHKNRFLADKDELSL